MNWDYTAGLFDGEGSAILSLSHGYVIPHVRIASSSEGFRQVIQLFLSREGIRSSNQSHKVKLGTTGYIQIGSWSDCEKFIDNIENRVIEKRQKVKVFRKALLLYKAITANNESTANHLSEFDAIRKELHSTSSKGRHQLKPW
jgi:hypothetical protein